MAPAGPRLFLNPAADERFVASVLALPPTLDPSALQLAIRGRYPKAVVRRSVVSDTGSTWYVYRDGAWVDESA